MDERRAMLKLLWEMGKKDKKALKTLRGILKPRNEADWKWYQKHLESM